MQERGIHYIDCGVSGGVWGLERGYCLMIGGDASAVSRLEPIFASLAPGYDAAPPTPGRTAIGTADRGYLHCGPAGAGRSAAVTTESAVRSATSARCPACSRSDPT